jgi:hypothetical protein
MAAKKKSVTVSDTTVDAGTQDAENWWYNMNDTEQTPYRDKFKAAYAPTSEEIKAAYDEAHAEGGAYADPRINPLDPNAPQPDTHAGFAPRKEGETQEEADRRREREIKDAEIEQLEMGDEPPAIHEATPGASATNPQLMFNDPPDGAPLYDRRTLPPIGNEPFGQAGTMVYERNERDDEERERLAQPSDKERAKERIG